jgi:Cys-tRNA(Pro)/Cys-tRNA(Cys) deacylase
LTPAINELKKHKVTFVMHKYKHDPKVTNYGLEAADKLNLDAARVYKTLLVELNPKELVVCIIPVNKSLSLKAVASFFDSKNALMANKDEAQKATGYLLGGISAFGQKKKHRTLLDVSAKTFETIYISGGKRGLDIELNPEDIIKVLNSNYENLSV